VDCCLTGYENILRSALSTGPVPVGGRLRGGIDHPVSR
jgi:hypothetical protein